MNAQTQPKPRNTPVVLKGAAALDRFCRVSGYDRALVDGQNDRTLIFVTTNGGKYQLNRKGTAVRTLQGPDFPRFKPGAQEE